MNILEEVFALDPEQLYASWNEIDGILRALTKEKSPLLDEDSSKDPAVEIKRYGPASAPMQKSS